MRLLLFLASTLSLLVAQGGAYAQRAEPRAPAPRGPLGAHEQAVVRLFEGAAPSVAYITTQGLARRGLFYAEVAQGAGSGFVWDDKGHIVTNHHVVAGARSVQVQLDAGKEPSSAPCRHRA